MFRKKKVQGTGDSQLMVKDGYVHIRDLRNLMASSGVALEVTLKLSVCSISLLPIQ